MVTDTMEYRRQELHALKTTNPARLIAMYRGYCGLDECQPLPRNVAFTSMIETILQLEESDGESIAAHAMDYADAMA